MLPHDPWQLVVAGELGRAIEEYTRRYNDEARPSHLRNRGVARLLGRDYDTALEDFERAASMEDARLQGASDLVFQGVCHWCLGRPQPALRCWRRSLDTRYTDPSGGVESEAVLYYAGLRLQDSSLVKEPLALLRKRWRRHLQQQRRIQDRGYLTHHDLVHPGLATWPGPVVPFLLGMTDAGDLQHAVDVGASGTLRVRQQCQADFYVALQALSEGDSSGFQMAMGRCARSSYGFLEHEYFLARWEVEMGFPQPAFGDVES